MLVTSAKRVFVESFLYENDFDQHENEHFHLKSFARRLVLKQRHKATQKWPIVYIYVICRPGGPYWEKLCQCSGLEYLGRPRPANNVFIIFFRRVLCKQFCVEFSLQHIFKPGVRVRLTFRKMIAVVI